VPDTVPVVNRVRTSPDGDAATGFHCDHAAALSCEDVTHCGRLHHLAR
jgi:hypothetical protein